MSIVEGFAAMFTNGLGHRLCQVKQQIYLQQWLAVSCVQFLLLAVTPDKHDVYTLCQFHTVEDTMLFLILWHCCMRCPAIVTASDLSSALSVQKRCG